MTIRNVFGTPIHIIQAQTRECWIETGPGVYDFFVHERKPSRVFGEIVHDPAVWFVRYVYADSGKKPLGHDWVHTYSLSADDGMREIMLACEIASYSTKT